MCMCVCACVRVCVRAFGRAYVCVSFYILRFDARIESICVFTVARQGIYRIDNYVRVIPENYSKACRIEWSCICANVV